MSEENQVVDAEVVSNESVDTPEVSIESQAKEKGWISKEDYKGDPEEFVSAKEYLRVGSMIARHKDLERKLDVVARQNQELIGKFREADMNGYKRAIAELQQQRKEALEMGDAMQADQITQQMDEYKATVKQAEQQVKQAQWSPEVINFKQRNSEWFGVDQRLTHLAVIKDQEFRIKHPDKSEAEILQMVENEVSPKRTATRPTPVATPNRTSVSVGKLGINDLNKDERDHYKVIKSVNTDFTVNEFVDQLKLYGAR